MGSFEHIIPSYLWSLFLFLEPELAQSGLERFSYIERVVGSNLASITLKGGFPLI